MNLCTNESYVNFDMMKIFNNNINFTLTISSYSSEIIFKKNTEHKIRHKRIKIKNHKIFYK